MRRVVITWILTGMLFGGFVGLAWILADPPYDDSLERHHAVVRQSKPIPGGWSVVVELEVGGHVAVFTDLYREPGRGVYVAVKGERWRLVDRPR